MDADHRTPQVETDPVEPEPVCLGSLMSRTILTRASALEGELPLGLALSANIVRVSRHEPVLVRDLPRRSGVAKQETTTMMNFLVRRHFAVIEPDAGSKGAKRFRLTDSGAAAGDDYESAVTRWSPPGLRRALEVLTPSPGALHADGGWRRAVKAPETLPHHPVVTGHGGYPDGS